MKKQLKRLSRSLASQNAFLIILSGCIMFLFVLALNPLFYTVTKDELTENVSGSIREVTVRLGFLLSKHRPALQLAQEEDFIHLVRTYYEEPEHAETNRRRIIGHLNNYEEVGLDEASGTINNHNFFLFYTEAGDLFCQDETSALADALISTEWFQDTVLEEFNKRYSAPLPLTVEGETENYLCLIRQFTVDDMRCFSIHLTYMDDFIGQLKFLENVGIYDYILYCEDQILYQNTDDTCLDMGYLRENDYLSTTQYGVVSVPHTDGIDFAALCSISSENMYLLVHTSRAELMQPYNAFFRLLYISLGLLITCMVIVSCIIVFSTLRGLTRLSQNLEQINLDNLTSVTTAPYRSDELEKIRRTTAMMLERIQDEVDEKLHYQEVEKQMQYTLMVSAVDPHFIYNTLDTVSFLASMGRTEDVVTVNDALISTLKDRLRTKAYRVFDTVSVEKDVIKNYMILQTYLCANTITCQFEAEPEHMDLLIPKNILQPLVENSIKHGLLTNKTKDRLKAVDGEIRIRITHAEERIGIHILDNGSGISEEQCAYYNEERVYEDFTGEHVGLLNIKLRLNYLYKGDYTFHIANRDEGGTCIDIYIPDTPPEWLN